MILIKLKGLGDCTEQWTKRFSKLSTKLTALINAIATPRSLFLVSKVVPLIIYNEVLATDRFITEDTNI